MKSFLDRVIYSRFATKTAFAEHIQMHVTNLNKLKNPQISTFLRIAEGLNLSDVETVELLREMVKDGQRKV